MTQQRRNVRPHQGRQFTGKHMAAIMIAFFGTVIAVNVVMARMAISTFGGVVVENSYVASQHFNGWLDEARTEKALGWKALFGRRAAAEMQVGLVNSLGKPLAGAHVTAIAEHPLGLRSDETLTLREVAPGEYAAPLPAGRWRLRLTAKVGDHTWRTVGDVL
ncbi:FixH family protein [Novosphingobium sp. KCTC 2891]|uniref:FixH family protein n=1 Tax=Novosphingobium sp. KCTC 2891 TaxID=2989730 RepID=UPI002222C410|nr:FixH family protein [Novosphingobium sp. KCTC 2891]MCW1381466.1 FixH family protein [Novosphingobium sp. KCTC 2891]